MIRKTNQAVHGVFLKDTDLGLARRFSLVTNIIAFNALNFIS